MYIWTISKIELFTNDNFTNQPFLAVNVEGDISIIAPYIFFLFYAKGSKPNVAHMIIKFQLKLFRKPEVKTEIYSIFFSKSCIRDTER